MKCSDGRRRNEATRGPFYVSHAKTRDIVFCSLAIGPGSIRCIGHPHPGPFLGTAGATIFIPVSASFNRAVGSDETDE